MGVKVEASIRAVHSGLSEEFSFVQGDVRELLQSACQFRKWSFEDRIKSEDSYAMKLMTGRYAGYVIDDFYACTIVVPNLKAVLEAIQLVKELLDVHEEKPGAQTFARPTSFDFDSVRLYCRLKQSVAPKPYQVHSFEVQIKTLLEHAWSKATHDFSYKGDEVSWARERLAAQIKAVLDNVDLSINELEDTAKSTFLARNHPYYEKLKAVISVLKAEFGADDSQHTITDYKRLAEQSANLLSRIEATHDELRAALEAEALLSRGRHIKNLSPYSIVLVSAATQMSQKFASGLAKRCNPKANPRQTKVVIPYEVTDFCDFSGISFQDVQILGQKP